MGGSDYNASSLLGANMAISQAKKTGAPALTRELSGCPIDFALELFGDRWTLLVVRDLLVRRKRYFSEFMASDEGIASNILAARLKKLEAWGIIERATDPDNKRQVIYSLTEKGIELAPVLVEIAIWSCKHDANTKVNKGYIRKARQDRAALAAETIDEFVKALKAETNRG